MSKIYYTYEQIHREIASLAEKVMEFKPDVMVAIGGGGLIPARILRTFIEVPVLVVTLESYTADDKQSELVKHQWLDRSDRIEGKRVLVVDEIDDTGATLFYCVNELKEAKPDKIGVAVLHNKLKEKRDVLDSDIPYYAAATVPDRWIVYPWDLEEV